MASVRNQADERVNYVICTFWVFLHFCGGRWENLTRTAGGRCAFLFPFFFFK